jgi:beta-galactosidase
MAMDGSPTRHSEMASSIAKWANAEAQKGLIESSPIKCQIGILYVPECSTVSYLLSLSGIENAFYRIMTGAWQGFFDNNIQADFVHIDDIDSIGALYFPYPVSLTKTHAEKLKDWVRQGGTLIAEACPGYIGDNLEAGVVQPNNGLDELFGAKEKRVEFMPDILTDITFDIFGVNAGGEGFLQTYECIGGCPCAVYQGEPIGVTNTYGKGKTLLVGAFVSGRYARLHDEGSRNFFARAFSYTNQIPALILSDNKVRARISRGTAGEFLWILNPTREKRPLKLTLPRDRDAGEKFWEGGALKNREGNILEIEMEERDALILSLRVKTFGPYSENSL